jgi:uncharacterized coiled-coil protein SlyX
MKRFLIGTCLQVVCLLPLSALEADPKMKWRFQNMEVKQTTHLWQQNSIENICYKLAESDLTLSKLHQLVELATSEIRSLEHQVDPTKATARN